MTKKKNKIPELKIVFDTSVIFNRVAYDLLNNEIIKIIKLNSHHADLNIKWYLPSIVINERCYQMQGKAFELLNPVKKLEKLLGHNLNINEEILLFRVNEAIKKQLSELNIIKLDLDTSKVDWNSIIQRSVFRQPPFEIGDKEKGFRDVIIANTFLQLLEKSPRTPSICLLAIVANDNLMIEYLKSFIKGHKNVRILSNVSDLEGLINTLVSKVTEEFIESIKEKIGKYFIDFDKNEGLFYKEKIEDIINEKYDKHLSSVPKEGLTRENGTWRISKPVFVKKKGQRTFWMSLISVDSKLFKLELPKNMNLVSSDSLLGNVSLNLDPSIDFSPKSLLNMEPSYKKQDLFYDINQSLISGNINKENTIGYPGITPIGGGATFEPPKINKINIANGSSIYEVHWSVNITPLKKLTNPRIGEIKFISNKWGVDL